jgi:hypothetical protein
MYWYNPKTRSAEDVSAPSTDEEALGMLSGDPNSWALEEHYVVLREEGKGVEQAMILVGHHSRMWHLRYQPVG